MAMALCTLSHSPLIGVNQPAPEVVDEVDKALDEARRAINDFNPDLVVVYGPDHYNGVFYDMMPQFCIANGDYSVGDWETTEGPLQVDSGVAKKVGASVLNDGIDIAVSARLHVDHGMTQPLEVLFGAIDAVPVIPIFINSVATPLSPVKRVRLLGEAVARAISTLDRRVLFLGSGGLSHDPPVTKLEGAPEHVAERLIAGRNPTEEARAARRGSVIKAAQELTLAPRRWLRSNRDGTNASWECSPRDACRSSMPGHLSSSPPMPATPLTRCGRGSRPTRRLSTAGPYEVTSSYYRPIPEWICGVGTTTARTAS